MSYITSNFWQSGLTRYLTELPLTALLLPAALFYLLLVQYLRFHGLRKIQRKHASLIENPHSMNYKTAHGIMKFSMLHEFAWMYFFGTTWALVKTYGIASGTGLLVQTRQLTTDEKVGKRAEDTGVIIAEITIGSMDSERGLRALSKMNWLHRRYGAKIGNEEMIHTMAMFVLEPQRWIERYEWRSMSELERVAAFIYWKEIGNRMGITNMPQTLPDLEAWVEKFEETHMIYADSNRVCAETTTNLYLRNVPSLLKNFARLAASSLLEDRVRIAVGQPEPPAWIAFVVKSLLKTRGSLVRFLFLPRWHEIDVLKAPGPDGRIRRDIYGFEPWYVKDNLWLRISTWLKTGGRLRPALEFKSAGYLPEELGPVEFEKASRDDVLKDAVSMGLYASKGGAGLVGCPFLPYSDK